MTPEKLVAKALFDCQIAMKVAEREIRTAYALGHNWFEAYALGYRALDEVLYMTHREAPTVLTRFRPIGGHRA